MANHYYDKIDGIIKNALNAFSDGKVTLSEIWAFMLVLGDAINTIIVESSNWSDADTEELTEAALQLYDKHVLPVDLPGPDFVIDPLIRNGIIPGLVQGAVTLANNNFKIQILDD